MSTTINQAFIKNASLLGVSALATSFLAPVINKDEKYVSNDTIQKFANTSIVISNIATSCILATQTPPFVFSISSFVIGKLAFFATEHLCLSNRDLIKRNIQILDRLGLDQFTDTIANTLSGPQFWYPAHNLFQIVTSVWLFKSLLSTHSLGTASHIALPVCVIGALSSETLINKSVEVLDPQHKWMKEDTIDELSNTVRSIFYTLFSCESLLTLIPPGTNPSLPFILA